MLHQWSSLLLTLHCAILTWPVTCQRLDSTRTPDNVQWQLRNLTELEKSILQETNGKDPALINVSAIIELRDRALAARQVQVYSQAANQAHRNVASFQLSSCIATNIREDPTNIRSAALIFFINFSPHPRKPVMKKRPPSWNRTMKRIEKLKKKNEELKERLQKWKNKSKQLNKSPGKQVATSGSSNQAGTVSKSGNNVLTHDQLVNTRSDELNRVYPAKVVVRVMKTPTTPQQTISADQYQVAAGKSARGVEIPFQYLRTIADTEDHLLSLQIVCKACGRQIWIDRVYTQQSPNGKKKQAAEKTLNEDRPFLIIRFKNPICEDE